VTREKASRFTCDLTSDSSTDDFLQGCLHVNPLDFEIKSRRPVEVLWRTIIVNTVASKPAPADRYQV
jgi:hypothetical protein